MQNSYIYIFLDPDYSEVVEFSFNNINYKFNNRIIYVGKGSFNDKGYNRIRAHFYGKKYIKKHFYYWLDKREKQYGRDFLINNYVIKLIDNLTDEDAFKKEEELVKLLGRNDLGTGTLLNLSDGGMGGVSPSKETIEKISTKNKGKFVGNKNGNYGNGNKYLGELNHYYGKTHTEEIKSKMRRYYLVYNKEENVNYYTDNFGEFCKNFNFTWTVYRHKLGCGKFYLNKWQIKKITKDIFLTETKNLERTNNYYCIKNTEEYLQINIKNKTNQKYSVILYDKNFNLIETFNNVKDAAEYRKVKDDTISKYCTKKIKDSKEYIWEYKGL